MKKFYPFLRYSSITVALTLIFSFAIGQINVTPPQTATALAQKLVGTGVTVLNPTLTCPTVANGIFNVVSSNLGLDSGIVLTSGTAKTGGGTFGVNGPASNFASTSSNAAGDPDLTVLAGQPTHDACILEFDFRPQGDTIKFEYVFGSEEYTSFSCTQFSDVFGFFISGPGYVAPTNIALVPGTNIPVGINTINAGLYITNYCTNYGVGSPFTQYFVQNINGPTVTYDGFTDVLTAIANVTPCDTYHLKLGVADASDWSYDSGVFIKAGSLNSTGIHLTSQGVPDTSNPTTYAVRGCSPGKFVFTSAVPLTDTETLHFIIGGTAVNGVDYTQIPDSLVLPTGSTRDSIMIYGLVPPTGVRTVTIYLLSPYTCNGLATIVDSATLTIYDPLFVHILTAADTTVCNGQAVHIITDATPHSVYQWSPPATLSSDTSSNPYATPNVTTTYTVSANVPYTGCQPVTATITINVVNPPVLSTGPDVTTCLNTPIQIHVVAQPADPLYIYSWTPAGSLNDAGIPAPLANPTSTTEYYVTVGTGIAFCNSIDSIKVRVLPNDFTLLNQDTTTCESAVVQVRATGDSEFTYRWTPPAGVSDPDIIDPVISTYNTQHYTITASYPNCPDMVHGFTIDVQRAVFHITTPDSSFCMLNPITLHVNSDSSTDVTYLWTPADGLSDPTVKEPSFYQANAGVYTYYLTLTTPIGCTSTDSIHLTVRPAVILAVTPHDTTIKYGDHVQFQALNLRPEPLTYFWTPDNGTLSNPNINYPLATPTAPATYTVVGMNEYGCEDSASVHINIDFTMNEFIPSAFSPNGDGKNDVFRILNMRYQKLLDFRVFNRWGQLIYHTDNAQEGWDGTFNGVPQDMGIYNYIIIVARPDGTEKSYSGTVTLVK